MGEICRMLGDMTNGYKISVRGKTPLSTPRHRYKIDLKRNMM
jgi:hypothetical protein